MTTRKTYSVRMRAEDILILDAMADAFGLTRGQCVESLIRRETRRITDAGPDDMQYSAVRGALSQIAEAAL